MANCKTAVSILQEHCAQQGMTPIYTTISQEGQSHQPKFTISCTAGSTVGTGEGVSKKTAKQAAAESILQQWELEIPKQDSSKEEVSQTPNPVGELQELVTFLGWRRPEYEEMEETGAPHDRSFTVGVVVGKFTEKGTDKSKRLAKRTAAQAMLDRIKSLPPNTDPGAQAIATKPKKKQGGAMATKAVGCSLQGAVGPNIERLCNNPLTFPDIQSCQILKLVAEEQKFGTSYLDLPELGHNNLYQCLVELKTSPLTVCHGTGPSPDEARANAARNALYYIKTMARKMANPTVPDPEDIMDNFEPPSHKNPVQMLNEMNVTPLQFSFDQNGPTHDPIYEASIKIEGITFSAKGKKKQAAKEEVARKALLDIFGVVSSVNKAMAFSMTRPTPSILYTTWKGKNTSDLADPIQNLIEQKLREVTFNAGQMRYIKYKVLAGVVQSDGDAEKNFKVVCLATGTNCPMKPESDVKGAVVYDCHAEVLACRCLKRYLSDQLQKHGEDPKSSIFNGGSGGMLQLREGVSFHLYISCPPCGDASSFIKEERSMKHGDNHPQRGVRGILRAKIKQGESTIPLTGKAISDPDRLFAMACSDKAASWNVHGVQGALLSHLIAPVYFSSVIIGTQCHPDHLPRALYGRLTDLPALPDSYKLNKPLMLATTRSSVDLFGISPSSKSPSFAINWISGDQNEGIEVLATDTGLTKDGFPSRICKNKLFSDYKTTLKTLQNDTRPTSGDSKKQQKKGGKSSKENKRGKQKPPRDASQEQNLAESSTYQQVKKEAEAYQECKRILKATFLAEGLGQWLKPREYDDFGIQTSE